MSDEDEKSSALDLKGKSTLEILSQIAILFSDEDEVAKLKAAQTPEELFALVSAAGVS